MDGAPLLSIQDVADKFGVCKATVHNWIKLNYISGEKMGKGRYFDEQEVRQAMKELYTEGKVRR